MSLGLVLKEPVEEGRLFRNRVVVSIMVMGGLLFLTVVRLAQIQILEYDHYTTLSHDNRVKILPIPPTRGLIFSRDGVLLAENRPSFSLEVIPEQAGDLKNILGELQTLVAVSQEDIDRFSRLVRQKRRFESVPLRFNLSEEEVARFAVNRYRFPGIDIVARQTRFYHRGELMGHIVGYVGRMDEDDLKSVNAADYSGASHIGKIGVEKSYESVLRGKVGYQQVEVNAQGRPLRVLERKPPKSGKNLYLTVHAGFQSFAKEVLGDRRGAAVAIDVPSGGVLAMVSTPGYDPNLFVNGIDAENYAQLRDSPHRPLFNRALQGKYPPGSTVKPFMGLAGLEYGVRMPDDATWCRGWYQLPREPRKYRCWRRSGHGRVDLKKAIGQSCDVYFYRLAQDLGIDRIHEYLSRFGFGRPTKIDLPGEVSGLLPSRTWKLRAKNVRWYPGETLITGIGQGYTSVTPVQLATATAMLANRGLPVQPSVAGYFEDPYSRRKTPNRLVQQKVSPPLYEHWAAIVESMVGVVHSPIGTARRAGEGAAYRFAGKTGTSQVFGFKQNQTIKNEDLPEHLRDHALFIAFAPSDKPEIALAVVVEHGKSGSESAAPIARQLLDWYFQNLAGRSPKKASKEAARDENRRENQVYKVVSRFTASHLRVFNAAMRPPGLFRRPAKEVPHG